MLDVNDFSASMLLPSPARIALVPFDANRLSRA
jgi:hypothetical protein